MHSTGFSVGRPTGAEVLLALADAAVLCKLEEIYGKYTESNCKNNKLLQDGWRVKVEHTLAGFQRSREGVFTASVKEAKMSIQSISTRRVQKSLCWYKTRTVA